MSTADDDLELVDGHPDRVNEHYQDKTILVTGATGFMGRVFIEKVLRACIGVKKIYILVRPKYGKDPQERVKKMFEGPLFNVLKEKRGERILKKVHAIAGDCAELGLAMSAEDRKLLSDEVEFIFHFAATIRFDEPFKKAILLNVRGTKLLLDLARECKKLMVFLHMSTAYCHLNERVLYEKAYPPPANPHNVIAVCEWLSEDVLESVKDKLLGEYPNSYAFSKALAESLVVDEMDNMPVIVIRPSIVLPIWLEPLPGWTDNLYGATGLLIATGKGVLRSMYIKPDHYADLIPVDIAVNGLIICCIDFLHIGTRRIYNATTSAEHQISFEEIIELGRHIITTKMPLNWVAWYPGGSMKRYRWVHNIAFLLFHIIPALFVDLLCMCLGYPPFLYKIQRRIQRGFEVFEYYVNNQWDFHNEDSLRARAIMNPTEKKKYKVDGLGINYEEYFTACIHSARLNILKEKDEEIPQAFRHMRMMYYVDKGSKTIIICGFLYLIYKHLLLPLFGY